MEKAEERGEEQLSDIATQRAVLPIRDWEIPEHRKIMPIELQTLVGAASTILRVERHAWEVVQPPPLGVKVNRNGDAAEGDIGKHFSTRPYFDNFDRLISEWRWYGRSPKSPADEDRWEIYIPVDERKSLLIIIGLRHGSDDHYLVSNYLINNTSVRNRLSQVKIYLFERGE
jgi:hypothetical protein